MRSWVVLVAVWIFASLFSPLRAQVVSDGATNTLSNVTNTFTGDVTVGTNGSFTLLVLSNNARLTNSANGIIGQNATARSNRVVVTDGNSAWAVSNTLSVGLNGSSGQLLVTNGAKVFGTGGVIGSATGSTNNAATVVGTGSLWSNTITLNVGNFGAGGLLLVSDGGTVQNGFGSLGLATSSSNNLAVVTGLGSAWSNTFELYVGESGPGNTLIVSNNGSVFAGNLMVVGFGSGTARNRVVVDGGAIYVTNAAGTGVFDVQRGTNVLNAGLIDGDQLLLTNASGFFEFNGGSLKTRNTIVNNGSVFAVGNGVSPASFELVGNGTHSFANALSVGLNGILKGSGSVTGSVFVAGSLSPGASIGRIEIFGALGFDLSATSLFELDKAAGTNDCIAGLSNLQYNGTLIVTNLTGTLANGDTFRLFASTRYFPSAFTNLVLPTLDPGLKWRNKLMMDGSLQVIAIPTRDFGVDVSHFQGESGVSQASWNQMFAQGKRFVFIKATEGLSVLDGAMANNVNRATAAGLRAGVYHFAHPELRPTPAGAAAEADYLLTYAGNFIGPGYLRPVLDLEFAAGNLGTTELTDWVIAFANEIVTHRGPGATPIIYCNQSFANFEFDSRLASYDLWLRTIGGSDPAIDDPTNSLGFDPTGVFDDWSFWQYSDTGSSGGISPLDLNVCHSEYKPLDSFLIPAVANPVAPSIAAEPQSRTVKVAQNASFSVTVSVSTSTPLFYQWRFHGTNLPGATANMFTRLNAQLADAGPYTVVITNAAGSITSAVATLTVTNPPVVPSLVLYEEDFDSYSSPSIVSSPGVINGFKIFFGAASGPIDFSARFGFDYSTVTSPTTIPSAPHSSGGTTKGLFVTVNKDATAALAAVNLYPVSQLFTGNFSLKLDLWINYPNSSTATEHALFGINHSANITNRVGQLASDGLFFAMDGDGGVSAGSATLRDFAIFAGSSNGAIPTLLTTVNTGFGPEPLLGSNFDNADAGFAGLFPSKALSFATAPGTAGNGWVAVEVRQSDNVITWLLNDVVVAQFANTSGFTNGNIMIGYNDHFASAGGSANFAIFDNIRVDTPAPVPPPIQLTAIINTNGAFELSFTNAPGTAFTVMATTNLSLPVGNWTEIGTVTEISTGQFQFTDPQTTSNPQRYYQVRWP